MKVLPVTIVSLNFSVINNKKILLFFILKKRKKDNITFYLFFLKKVIKYSKISINPINIFNSFKFFIKTN